jgi:hypothetical protein
VKLTGVNVRVVGDVERLWTRARPAKIDRRASPQIGLVRVNRRRLEEDAMSGIRSNTVTLAFRLEAAYGF